jgi:hypothetical protein
MQHLDHAILRTILYADVFDFPLTAHEIHHYLIHDGPVPLDVVQSTLQGSRLLANTLTECDGFYALANRSELINLRRARRDYVKRMWPRARRYARWLASLPYVRMVALTGALAVHNPLENDDYDYMLVVKPGRVWLARAFAIVLVRVCRLYGDVLCPNYVTSENALAQKWQNLFLAHELAQMVPLYGIDLYWRARRDNIWSEELLPNALEPLQPEPELTPGTVGSAIKRTLEFVLNGPIGNWLENWESRRKLKRFAGQMKGTNSAAQIDSEQVKGHFDDHGHPVLRAYHDRLRAYDLMPMAEPLAGD